MTRDDHFAEFWRLYPRKEAKLDAMKAWQQMTRQHCPDDIIAGLRANLPAIQRREPKFRKLPAGWLRDGRWMDEPEPDRAVARTGHSLLDALGRHTH